MSRKYLQAVPGLLVLLLAGGIYAERVCGMFLLRPHQAARLAPVLVLIPVAVLTSVTVSQAFTTGRAVVLDARLPGLAVAAVCVWRRLPQWVMLPLAAGTTAFVRSVGWAS